MNLKLFQALLLGLLLMVASAEAQDTAKKIVVTITESTIVKAGFGLAVANAMQDAGVQSTVFITADAVHFASSKGSQLEFAGHTPRELMQALIKKGGKVMVCEGFVKLGVIKKSEIIEGVGIAAPGDLAGALYAPNTQTMTF